MILWYIDESGVTKEERNIVVGGFGIDDNMYETILEDFRKLKAEFLENPHRKIDMKRLIQGKDWARTMLIEKRKEFLKAFYEFIKNSKMRISMIMLDRDNSSRIRNKLQFAYECLFERICLNVEDVSHIERRKNLAILFTDTMTNYREVQSWFETFYEKGTAFVTNSSMIERIVPLKMSQSEMLQIADLIICTCSYWIKANKQQKSVQWAKDVLTEGWKVMLEKEVKVRTQDNKKDVQSIYFYSKPF